MTWITKGFFPDRQGRWWAVCRCKWEVYDSNLHTVVNATARHIGTSHHGEPPTFTEG